MDQRSLTRNSPKNAQFAATLWLTMLLKIRISWSSDINRQQIFRIQICTHRFAARSFATHRLVTHRFAISNAWVLNLLRLFQKLQMILRVFRTPARLSFNIIIKKATGSVLHLFRFWKTNLYLQIFHNHSTISGIEKHKFTKVKHSYS